MNYLSLYALILFPAVVCGTYIVPSRFRSVWLFLASLVFYGMVHPVLSLALVLCCLLTYAFGLLLARAKGRGAGGGAVLFAGIVLHLAILLLAKYGVMVLPGASFFLLQSLGYLIDVYRGDVKAERNVLRISLFIAFFPNILSGPIERAGRMLPQFASPKPFDYDRLRDGLLTMLWGYFLKLVLAERMAVIVNTVYASVDMYEGGAVVFAVFIYALQIYCDFAGYSCIAIGAAGMLGIKLMDNFTQPYLVSDFRRFWHHWHISLSTWFRDYLYIPLGGSRKGRLRHMLNLLVVFAVSGFWHGADLTFVFWGLLHGVYQCVGALLPGGVSVRRKDKDGPTAVWRAQRPGGKRFSARLFGIIVNFVLVAFAWIWFRAEDFSQAAAIVKACGQFTPWVLTDGTLFTLGLDRADMGVLALGFILMLLVDIAAVRGIRIRERIAAQGLWLRVTFCAVCFVAIVVMGLWGSAYDAGAFIYQQF